MNNGIIAIPNPTKFIKIIHEKDRITDFLVVNDDLKFIRNAVATLKNAKKTPYIVNLNGKVAICRLNKPNNKEITMRDSLILMINGTETTVPKNQINEINNGKALTTTGRWYPIICNCLEVKDYEYQPAEPENDVPEAHIVCNQCNKVTYTKDLE